MRQQSTGDKDSAAEVFALRLGGLPSQTVPGFENREFDVISSEFIAQTTASRSAVLKPANFLTSSRKAQIRATLMKMPPSEVCLEISEKERLPASVS